MSGTISIPLSSLKGLTTAECDKLRRARVFTVLDLMMAAPRDISTKCGITPAEVDRIIVLVSSELAPCTHNLADAIDGDEKFSTGDPRVDDALGGGFRTGMLWEVVGESAAGKTQLALQSSLMVQNPRKLGGLSGSTCFLTTSSTLPTSRLTEMTESHPLLSPSLCSLADIHTMKVFEIEKLIQVLSFSVPALIEKQDADPSAKPVKLVVIDALAELFHSDSRTSKQTLYQRSRSLSEISSLLHNIASKHQVVVLILNEVIAASDPYNADTGEEGEVLYRDQARLFGRADSLPGEDRREAALGLVWANQVNARIMLTRTGRMRHVEDLENGRRKRRRLESGPDGAARVEEGLTRVRRLNVIFNSVGPPASLDYVVCDEGIVALPEDIDPAPPAPSRMPAVETVPPEPELVPPNPTPDNVSVYDVAADATDIHADAAEGREGPNTEAGAEDGPQADGDDSEWEQYWKDADTFSELDLDTVPDTVTGA